MSVVEESEGSESSNSFDVVGTRIAQSLKKHNSFLLFKIKTYSVVLSDGEQGLRRTSITSSELFVIVDLDLEILRSRLSMR